MKSVKTKPAEFFYKMASIYSKDSRIEPLILLKSRLEERASIDKAVEAKANRNWKELSSNKNLTKSDLAEEMHLKSKGVSFEDAQPIQTFRNQSNSDMMQDYIYAIFHANKKFYLILFVAILCLYGYNSFPLKRSKINQSSVFNSIIYVKSKLYNSIFQINITEIEDTNQKTIVDLDVVYVKYFLGFVISKELEYLPWEKVTNLSHVAHERDLTFLKNSIISFLKSQLSVSNVCEILQIAVAIDSSELYYAAEDFICSNANEVFASDDWKKLLLHDTELAADIVKYFSNLKGK